MWINRLSLAAAGIVLLALGACSSAPKQSDADVGARAARHALEMQGKPYRAGGSSPRRSAVAARLKARAAARRARSAFGSPTRRRAVLTQ